MIRRRIGALAVLLIVASSFGVSSSSAQPSASPDAVQAEVLSWGQGCDGQVKVTSINNDRTYVVSFSNTGESPCTFNVPSQALQFGDDDGFPDGAYLVTVDWTNALGINRSSSGATVTEPDLVRFQLDSRFTQDLANNGHGAP